MLFIILQAVNLFEEKENNSSLPLATQHLGTGNACLIKVRGRTGKKKNWFLFIKHFFQHLQSGHYCKLSSLISWAHSHTMLTMFKATASLHSFVCFIIFSSYFSSWPDCSPDCAGLLGSRRLPASAPRVGETSGNYHLCWDKLLFLTWLVDFTLLLQVLTISYYILLNPQLFNSMFYSWLTTEKGSWACQT